MKLRISTILLFLFGSLCSSAQQFDFIEYSINEGLAHSQVRSIYQDDQGFLWIGTLGGASKFDGRKFVNYSEEDGLLGNQVNHIHQLQSGELIFGVIGGFSIFNGTEWESYSFAEELQQGQVNDILEDGNGNLWIAFERGLALFKDRQFTYYTKADGLSDDNVKAVAMRPDGALVIATKLGVDILQDQQITPMKEIPDQLPIMDMTMDSTGKIWLATNLYGLVTPTVDSIKSYSTEEGLISNRLTGIGLDKEQRFWLRSKNGISRFNGEKIQNFTDANGLPVSDIRAFCEDFEGNIWLGSDGGGLLKYTGDAFSAYTTAEGLSSNLVMSIVQDESENMWFSTFDQGVTRISPDGEATAFSTKNGLPNNTVWTSASTSNGESWFGTSTGLSRFRDGEFTNYYTSDGLSHNKVIFIYPDQGGSLIFGTNNGYTIFRDEVFQAFDGSNGFRDTKVRAITRSHDSTLWLGTLNGVYAYNGNSYVNFNEENGLPDNTVYALDVDSHNYVWIGTADGLAVYAPDGTLNTVKIDDNYRANTINFLTLDRDDFLWVGTNNGIYQLNTEDYRTSGGVNLRHYTIDDGIRSLETNLNAAYRDSSGMLWFGTPAGVLRCDLSELDELINKVPPKTIITEVRLNLEPTDWNNFTDSINHRTGLPTALTVGHNNNHFSFSFTGISNSDPQQVKYQYQMKGFDEDWQPLTSLDFATYTNLPYDEFEFQVRSLSKNGVWSKPDTFSFSISPPVWLTWWFITLAVIAFALTVTGIYRYRRRNLITSLEKEKYEFQSKMLTLEQQSLNSSMNRHFIFNALNSIQYYINRKDRLSANIYLSNFAKLIRKNLDSSQSNFTSLREEIERLELYLNLEHMRFKDKFEYSIEIDSDVDAESIEVPAMLLQPFLENSIWHGILPKKETGEIRVRISKTEDNEILFSIIDNGIGIDTSRKQKLNTTTNHISKGMSITTGRIDLIRKMTRQNIKLEGPYEIINGDNVVCGTEVRIYLPVDIQQFYPN